MDHENQNIPVEQVPSPEEHVPVEVQDHLFTPANVMTVSRPIIAAKAAEMLINGKRGVTPVVLAAGATDAEGNVARAVDKWSVARTGQKNGYGTTEAGKSGDPIADTLAFLEIAAAALKSPRTSALGKVAVGIVLGQESLKSTWAVRANKAHQDKYDGEKLVLDVTRTGKNATSAKFAALTGAVMTHDLEPGKARTAAGIAAVGSAITGAVLGEKARRGYNKKDLAEKGIVVNMVPKMLRRKKATPHSTKIAA